MKLSIIIPVYNGAATIRDLVTELNAKLASRFDLEVVLVNDASRSDNSAEVCEEIALGNPWVTFLLYYKMYVHLFGVLATVGGFVLYFPPIPAYMFGAYLLLSHAALSLAAKGRIPGRAREYQ